MIIDKLIDNIIETNAPICVGLDTHLGVMPESFLKDIDEKDLSQCAHKIFEYNKILIDKLVKLSMEEMDHPTVSFLQWYVDEQVEEEKSSNDILQKLKMVDKIEGGIFLLDERMGERDMCYEYSNEYQSNLE